MKEYVEHPIAALFPLMTGPRLDELRESIRTTGQKLACVLFEGKILDGRNRYKVCCELGIDCRFEEPAIDDPFAYVAAMNLARRDLTASQRGMIAAEMANMKRGRPWSENKSGEIQINTETLEAEPVTEAKAAKIMNVSQSYVARGRRVLKSEDPELIQSVKTGKKSIDAAVKNLRSKPKKNGQAISLEERKDREDINRIFVKGMTPTPQKMEKEFQKLLIQKVNFYLKKVILFFPRDQRERARTTLIELMQTRAEELSRYQ